MDDEKPGHVSGEDAELITTICGVIGDLTTRSDDVQGTLAGLLYSGLGVDLTDEEVASRPTSDLIKDLGRRLRNLVDVVGLAEELVVRAIRDELTRRFANAADVGKINAARADFKAATGKELGDLSPDQTAELWAVRERWDTLVSLHLSDERIEQWRERNAIRHLREAGY